MLHALCRIYEVISRLPCSENKVVDHISLNESTVTLLAQKSKKLQYVN